MSHDVIDVMMNTLILQNVQTVINFFLLNILTECTSYDQARHQYYSFTDIKNILNLTPSQNILHFLKINLYDQL